MSTPPLGRRTSRRSIGAWADYALTTPRAYVAVAASLFILTIVAAVVGTSSTWTFLPDLAPGGDGSDPLMTLWQVLCTFVAVGFAGLAIMFQIAPQDTSFALDRRRVLLDWAYLRPTLFVGTGSIIVAGIVAIWLPSDGALIATFLLLLLPSVALIGVSYWRCADAFTHPEGVSARAEELLRQRLQRRLTRTGPTHRALDELHRANWIVWTPLLESHDVDDPSAADVLLQFDQDVRVEALDARRLARLARSVRRRAGRQAPAASTVDSKLAPSLWVRAEVGRLVRRGQPVIYVSTTASARRMRRWRQAAGRCVTVVDADLDPVGQDVGFLRDGINSALAAGRLQDAAAGLLTYRRLFLTLSDALEARGETESGLDGVKEAQALRFGLYELGFAAANRGPMHIRVFLDALKDMALDAAQASNLAAFRTILLEYEFLWEDCLKAKLESVVLRRMTVQLTSLASEGAYPSRVGGSEPRFTELPIITLTNMLKTSLDRRDGSSRNIAAEAIDSLYRYAGPPIRRKAAAAGGSALALLGWELARANVGTIDEDALTYALARADTIPDDVLLPALDFALEEAENSGSWGSWERGLQPLWQAHWVQLPTQVRRAAVLAGLPIYLYPAADTWSDEQAGQMRALHDAATISTDGLAEPYATRCQAFADAAKAMIDDYGSLQRARCADSPIDRQRVDALRDALVVGLGADLPDILEALSARNIAELDGDTSADWPPIVVTLPAPRAWFQPSTEVFDAHYLTTELVNALRGFQVQSIVEGIGRTASPTSTRLADLPGAIDGLTATFPGELLVIVLRSKQVEQSVKGLGLPGRFAFEATDDEPARVLIVDLDRSGRLELHPDRRTPLKPLGTTGYSWSVEEQAWDGQSDPTVLITLSIRARWYPGDEDAVTRLDVLDAEW